MNPGNSWTDPTLTLLDEALPSLESALQVAPPPEGRHEAAVSLVLRDGSHLEILLIERAQSERDPWSGDIALPGGRREPRDNTVLETAVRETEEETGVELPRVGRPLGYLSRFNTRNPKLPALAITPFIFGVGPETGAKACSREVESVFWVPLAELLRPETRSTVTIEFSEGTREFPCIEVAGHTVWGLTYRILTEFSQILSTLGPDWSPLPPP
jgi:8-oxo-dGTP pyrophosphatase MutT (NUDIX family)